MEDSIKILAISGSLRTGASSTAVLKAMATMVPENVIFQLFDGLGSLPPFDGSEEAPEPVAAFRHLLASADAVVFCTPEYAFGVPGTLKNALDWTVPSGELVGKPVAVISAATGGENALASLLLTLGALSANIPEHGTLLLPFIRSRLAPDGQVGDSATLEAIRSVLQALLVLAWSQV